jgi:two-component system sensor histidine kinase MprB
MSFRRRIALASAAAVAIAVVLASLLTYLLTAHQLHSQIDSQLQNRGHEVLVAARYLEHHGGALKGQATSSRGLLGVADLDAITPGRDLGAVSDSAPTLPPLRPLFGRVTPGPGQVRGYEQLVDGSGHVLRPSGQALRLPVDAATRRLAAQGGTPLHSSARVEGIHLRILALALGRGRAVQLAQPLTETDHLLANLRLILVLIGLGGIALAALLGRLVAGTAIQPLRRLTEASEHIALTHDLSERMEPVGTDEIGRLAASFNAMLDALEGSMRALDASVDAQRQLVADASHELRTPVTSLRTNIEILQQQGPDMDREEQRRMLADLVEQIEELTLLVNDLIELARGEEPRDGQEELRLDLLVGEAVERAARRTPATDFALELEPTVLAGVAERLQRAVGNLLDNAVKYSPPGAPVDVRLAGGELSVRDRGPGIAEQDLPHVFDRFYRGAEARSQPGSGLGLAIVSQVARQHGGSVRAERAPGGGTIMRLTLPGCERVAHDDAETQLATASPPPAAV